MIDKNNYNDSDDNQSGANVYNNYFNSNARINNLQQGDYNSINKKIEVDYSELIKVVKEIKKLRPMYLKDKKSDPEASTILDELQKSAENKVNPSKIKLLWNKLKNIVASDGFGNLTEVVSTLISAYTIFK
ncbi:MAG: hypothetical protein N4R38_03265 [Lactobacillus crispatus]|nr:hypothetical protein [Lactobacillus crispatus]